MSGLASALRAAVPPVPIHTVVTCLVWYLVSSTTSQLAKVILVRFTYPLFLLLCQFLMGGLFSLFFINCSRAFPQLSAQYFPPGSLPIDDLVHQPVVSTSRTNDYTVFSLTKLKQILPMGMLLFVGKLFLLNATSLISLATVSSVKALSPIMIVTGYRIVYNVRLPLVTYLLLAPLVCGVVCMIVSDSVLAKKGIDGTIEAMPQQQTSNPIRLSDLLYIEWLQLKGLCFCLLSTITYAAQNIYLKQLVTWDAVPGANPTSLVLSVVPSKSPLPVPIAAPGPVFSTPQGFAGAAPIPATPPGGIVGSFGLGIGLGQPPKTPGTPTNNFFSFRQRAGTIRLPYSSSDLRLDEKKDEVHAQLNSYHQKVAQGLNPIAKSINAAAYNKPDKMTIVLYCSIIGFVFSFTGFAVQELPDIVATFSHSSHGGSVDENVVDTVGEAASLMVLVILDSLSHFVQSVLSFYLLGLIPALSYSVASMMKRIVIITVSIVFAVGIQTTSGLWYSQITREQIVGLVMISVGLYCYDRWGSTALRTRS